MSEQETEVNSADPNEESAGTSSAGTSAASPADTAASETSDAGSTSDESGTSSEAPPDAASSITREDIEATAGQPPNDPGNTGGPSQPQATEETQSTAPTMDNTVDGDGNAIIVPSGAAATPNTPPSTLASNSLQAPADTPQGSQDPALIDPVGTAQDANRGRTSDPASRVADSATVEQDAGLVAGDTHPDSVPQDITEGPKPSDGGPVAYPFPVQGDVEVALIEPKVYEGEKMEPLHEGDFVVLGEHELVPAVLVGAEAAVLDAPTIICNCDWAPRTHEHIHPSAGITVQTRDDKNARLTVPLSAIARILRGGRVSR